MAMGAFGLQWLEYQYAIRRFSTEIYILILALLFTTLGIWIGSRLNQHSTGSDFNRNEQVISTLGLSSRELEVLGLVADGKTNQQIADLLFISNSTVKTHLVHLYQKLEVQRRTQAVQKAKTLKIIP